MIRIFHTSDNHLGMTFTKYPEEVRSKLIEARVTTLEKMVEFANDKNANLFVVAGDLFNTLNVSNQLIKKACDIFRKFTGNAVLILPGNHDYYSGNERLWEKFYEYMSDETLILNEFRKYQLDIFGVNADIYPAFCQSKHGKVNNLDWIVNSDINHEKINIGIAHGAFEGITPDLEGNYFYMSREQLNSIDMDIWLLGHTHIPYPEDGKAREDRIFNAGTHEPDGMNYRYGGSGFLIDINQDKKLNSERFISGEYRFKDMIEYISGDREFEDLIDKLNTNENKKMLLRLNLKGYLEKEIYERRSDYYKILSDSLLYFDIIDDDLKLRLTKDAIADFYMEGSFPFKMLEKLENDEMAVQMAFDLIESCKEEVRR
ncbi:MAG: metallophosphoesterase [Tissierellia bacterium]|nr:metallophosphoesterase [Tissierellia bacterium]